MSLVKKILLVVGIVVAAFIVLSIIVGVTGGGKPNAGRSPSSSPTTAATVAPLATSSRTTIAGQTTTAAKPSTMARTSATSHAYKTSGEVPAPLNQYVGGQVCDATQTSLANGKLLVMGVQPVTTWSVEFDDRMGQPVGDDASGMVGVGDDSINAIGSVKAAIARLAMAGTTTGQCVVIAGK